MDSENSLPPSILAKEAFVMIFLAFSISIGALEISITISDQTSFYLLRSMACLTFFLGATLVPLRFTMNPTKLSPISARLIDYLAMATLIASVTTLIHALSELCMALPDLNEITSWAIHSVLICFAVAGLHKLIREKFTFYHHKCLNVAFLNLCIAFSGLYFTWPLCYPTVSSPYSSIIYRTDRIYQFALLPSTFVLGTILLIVGVVPEVDLCIPFVSVISKEGLTVSTLATGLITLLTGTFSMVLGVEVGAL